MAEKDRIAVTMDKDLKKAIRVEAAKRDTTMAELAREILEEEFGEGNPNAMSAMTAD